jgi:hypothetical protein
MGAPQPTPTSPADGRLGSLSRFAWGNLAALLLEAALGIGLNLYVSVPSSPSYVQVFASIPLLTAHIVLGLLLVLATGALLGLGLRAQVTGLTWRAGLVFLFVLVALQEGFSYTFTGNAAFATGMALAFVLAFVFELLVVMRLRQAARALPSASP